MTKKLNLDYILLTAHITLRALSLRLLLRIDAAKLYHDLAFKVLSRRKLQTKN